jgi:hypothetical protein
MSLASWIKYLPGGRLNNKPHSVYFWPQDDCFRPRWRPRNCFPDPQVWSLQMTGMRRKRQNDTKKAWIEGSGRPGWLGFSPLWPWARHLVLWALVSLSVKWAHWHLSHRVINRIKGIKSKNAWKGTNTRQVKRNDKLDFPSMLGFLLEILARKLIKMAGIIDIIFWARVSLCSPGWPQIFNPFTSDSWMLGLPLSLWHLSSIMRSDHPGKS